MCASSTSSAVSAGTRSASTLPATSQLSLFASDTNSAGDSSSPDSLACQFMRTCAHSMPTEEARSCSLEGHPANEPASVPLFTANETAVPSGLRCDVSPLSWRLNGLSWSSRPATRAGKPKCVTIWAQMATTVPKLNSRLETLVRLISAGECSFLPTPVSRDWRSPGRRSHERLRKSRGQPLPEIIGSRVHPELCEWLMGLPSGWTAMLPSKQSGTQTRRRWRRSSDAQS